MGVNPFEVVEHAITAGIIGGFLTGLHYLSRRADGYLNRAWSSWRQRCRTKGVQREVVHIQDDINEVQDAIIAIVQGAVSATHGLSQLRGRLAALNQEMDECLARRRGHG